MTKASNLDILVFCAAAGTLITCQSTAEPTAFDAAQVQICQQELIRALDKDRPDILAFWPSTDPQVVNSLIDDMITALKDEHHKTIDQVVVDFARRYAQNKIPDQMNDVDRDCLQIDDRLLNWISTYEQKLTLR